MNLLSAIIFLALLIVIVALAMLLLESNRIKRRQLLQLGQINKKYTDETQQWQKHSAALKSEIQRLSRWQTVADADAKASEILNSAQAQLSNAEMRSHEIIRQADSRANEALFKARKDAEEITRNSKEKASSALHEGQAAYESAINQAARIVDEATEKAREIAGSAYDVKEKASLFERTAKAMKNIINGYGDEYLIPSHSILDDLAEEFGHADAGRELKSARKQTKALIKNQRAGTCDYVEDNRRVTAINFVVDAFDGKVDSILSRVKHDNFGKLQQELDDCFTLVNFNGKAFRDARITDEYLSSRRNELRWGAIVHQLKLAEREEQRRIKEQIREEAKARKEYERALRDAAKEEGLIHKAMAKAQEQIQRATEEQRSVYEKQLEELTLKLKEAEDKSQRAKSMAEQTKQGNVYIISNIGSFGEHVYKIGLTRRLEPMERIKELGDSSVPFEFDVHAMIFSNDAPALERQLHKHFVISQLNKVNHRKEFFRVELSQIRREIEDLGLSTKWTMTSEAREYRESLVIEQAINGDTNKREAWLSRQLELDPVDFERAEVTAT